MWKKTLRFLEDLYCRYEDDEIAALGAQMTYYLILSFFPFLIVLLTLAGLTPLSEEEVWSNLAVMLPEATFLVISDIIRQIVKERNDALLSVGMFATIWAASNGLNSIIKGLNKAYDEAETRPWWRVRAISVVYTLAIAVVLTLTIALLVFGHLLGTQMFRLLEAPGYFEAVWDVVKFVIPTSTAFLAFLLLYRNAPNRSLKFRSVVPGALFASIGWVGISLAFAFYVNHFNAYTRTYGSIGGIIVLLVWLYLSSMILLVGGEVNAVFIFNKEGRRKPKCKSFSNRLQFWKKE